MYTLEHYDRMRVGRDESKRLLVQVYAILCGTPAFRRDYPYLDNEIRSYLEMQGCYARASVIRPSTVTSGEGAMSAISTTALMALSDPKNVPTVLRSWEDHRPGWHEWDWCKKQLAWLIAKRERMITAGELTPRRPRA
ncbi:MAG TPA: hypothetical protein VJP02_02875 [Candidatus Sulfotelmatobacter sp.]|nr:hypothetical protein [Candidatus Sulfotelmatobacter sp.]